MKKFWRRGKSENNGRPKDMQLYELREFIYLDEVSVISLLSSRLGKLPEQFTETLTESKKAEINAQVEASVAVAKSRVGSRFESSQTEDSKVLSKATIQATFKNLYDIEKKSLSLSLASPDEHPPESVNLDSLDSLQAPWFIKTDSLRRGRLAEMEVELQADASFRVSAILGTMMEIMKENKGLFKNVDSNAIENLVETNRMLEKLMAGLVPVKCRLVDYELLTGIGKPMLVHKLAIDRLVKSEPGIETQPVFLVGVAEQGLFWKDLRRVLFSGARFRVLCRLNGEGVQDSWTAVKLADVLSEAVPGLRQEIKILGPALIGRMATGSLNREQFASPRIGALVSYGDLIANQIGKTLSDVDRIEVERIATETADMLISLPEGRRAFTAVAEYVAGAKENLPSPADMLGLRQQACANHGLYPGGTFAKMESVSIPDDLTEDSKEVYVDAEIVALYW